VKEMDKKLYYRIMIPASLLAIVLLLVPRFPVGVPIGFLVIFSGFFLYYRLSKKQEIAVQPVYIKNEQEKN
jgi:hypothetical protein